MKDKINFEKCMKHQCNFCKYKDRCFKEVDNERNYSNKSNKQFNR